MKKPGPKLAYTREAASNMRFNWSLPEYRLRQLQLMADGMHRKGFHSRAEVIERKIELEKAQHEERKRIDQHWK